MQNKTYLNTKFLLAAVSGLLLSCCFPKPGFNYLAFIALTPLLISIEHATPKQSFRAGLLTGIFHFLTLIYWIIPTLVTYGRLHPLLAVFILIGLCLYLSLYTAFFSLCLKRINPSQTWYPLCAATIWTAFEYIRTHAFTGFPWGLLGYSQHKNLKFIQIVDIFGVYGVSFLLVLVSSLMALLWSNRKTKLKKCTVPCVYTFIMVLCSLAYGIQSIKTINNEIRTAPKAVIGIVQGNIRQDAKWGKDSKTKTVKKYNNLSASLKNLEPDLIIWPETALPFYYQLNRPESDLVNQTIKTANTYFLIGSLAYERNKNNVNFYNRAYMINPTARVTGYYDKHHLVPFGEYVPFGQYLTFLGKITAQAGDFSASMKPYLPLEFKQHKTGVLICFEILFPSITSEFIKNGASILTTITNDAWFGRTSAAEQHFAIGVFRAVESRRTLSRAANTGISGFINPAGKILETTDLFTDKAIMLNVPALSRITFYSAHGDFFAWAACIAILLAFMIKRFRNNDQGE